MSFGIRPLATNTCSITWKAFYNSGAVRYLMGCANIESLS
jgi:hypothetical protein